MESLNSFNGVKFLCDSVAIKVHRAGLNAMLRSLVSLIEAAIIRLEYY